MSEVVVQACAGNGGEPAGRNPARNTYPLPEKAQFQWSIANQKACVLGGEVGARGEDKAQHALGRCRGVGENMGQARSKVGARPLPVCEPGRWQVRVAEREEEKD